MKNRFGRTIESMVHTLMRCSKVKLGAVILLLLCMAIVAFLIFRPANSAAGVTILQDGFPSPRRSFGIISRLPPSVQVFVYRVKQKLFGSARPVNLNAIVVQSELPSRTMISKLSLGKPAFAGTNGLQIWILATNDLQRLSQQVESLSESPRLFSPRISTAHGVRANMSVSTTVSVGGVQKPIGLALDCLPYVRKNLIDLTMLLTLTEAITNQIGSRSVPTNAGVSIRSNSFGALRIRIPNGSGAFLLQESTGGSGSKGVIISPSVPQSKR